MNSAEQKARQLLRRRGSKNRVPKRDFWEVNFLGFCSARAKINVFSVSVFGLILEEQIEQKCPPWGLVMSPKQWKSLYEMKNFSSGDLLEDWERTKKHQK
jgi:hypothetical protein